ncbi:MAG: zinc ribbon domain-containing protein [Exilibacterium sp.]
MPIYEYQCQSCNHEMEALQKMSDAPLTDCPACGASALKKRISAVGFRLAGSGWYETDFKSGNKKNLAGDSGGGKDGAQATKDSSKNSGGAKSETGGAGKGDGGGAAKSAGGKAKSSESA